jgi:hypothetical protein
MGGGSAHLRWLLTGVVSTRLERFPDRNAVHTVVRVPVTCYSSGPAITAVLLATRGEVYGVPLFGASGLWPERRDGDDVDSVVASGREDVRTS